ncbi:MAG: ABC transporter permease, partial [Chloroflexaceae bacterium]|nr:ABC transporter permease [Chloroflexaceae bacterium]
MASTPVTNRPRSFVARKGSSSAGRALLWWQQLILQLFCLTIAASVLFPVMWIVSLSLDPRNISRPTELTLIPPGASLTAYLDVLDRPTANDVTFAQLALNSFKLAAGVSFASVMIGVSAAYAFARFKFAGRQALMISVLAITVLPAVATIAPLFAMLNGVRLNGSYFQGIVIALGAALLLITALLVIPRVRDGEAGLGTLG